MGGGDRNFDAMRWFMQRAGNGHIVVLRASQGSGSARSSTARSAASSRSRPSCSRIARPPPTRRSWPRSSAPTASSWRVATKPATCASGAGRRWPRRWMRMSAPANRWPAPALAWRSRASTCTARWTAAAGHPAALADPLGDGNTIETDFLHFAALKGIITDTHFSERGRRPPDRVRKPRASTSPAGRWSAGVDEDAAVAVAGDGTAHLRHRAGRRRDRGARRLRPAPGRGRADEPRPRGRGGGRRRLGVAPAVGARRAAAGGTPLRRAQRRAGGVGPASPGDPWRRRGRTRRPHPGRRQAAVQRWKPRCAPDTPGCRPAARQWMR